MATRLFVGNLHPQTTREQLERFFSSAGLEVVAVRVPVDRQTGQRRGFAFVEFTSEEDAARALTVFDGREVRGQRLRVKWARERTEVGSSGNFEAPEFGDLEPPPAGAAFHLPHQVEEDYSSDRGRSRRRHGKHGSDRRHRVGVRRRVD